MNNKHITTGMRVANALMTCGAMYYLFGPRCKCCNAIVLPTDTTECWQCKQSIHGTKTDK